MRTWTKSGWLIGALLLAPLAQPLAAQQASKRLEPTASEPAQTAFRTALYEAQNLGTERARQQLATALAADGKFGLARVYQTVLTAGLTPAEREAQIAPQLGAMGAASPAEVLLALYWRETASGRAAAAVPIIRAAAELVPEDPEIAYIYDNTQRVGKPVAEQVASLRRFLERFPTHAAAHNQLAYTLWRAGDPEGALAAVQQYEKHAPDHPNSHDSHADILLLMGRGAEALPHVQREIELDPTFTGAYAKLGSIELTRGDVNAARSHFTTAVSRARTPTERIEGMNWQAVTHVYQNNARAAVQDFLRVADAAKEANLPGAASVAYLRAAVIDAYIGNRKAVAGHLAAAAAAAVNDNQRATVQAHAVVAHSRLGQTAEARAAAQQFAVLAPGNQIAPTLDAIIALDARDYPAAEAAMAKVSNVDPLSKALRAELFMHTGRKADGQALQKAVLSSSVKMDGNPPVEFLSVIGRLRAGEL